MSDITQQQGGPKNRTCLSIDNSAVEIRVICQNFQNDVKNRRHICI